MPESACDGRLGLAKGAGGIPSARGSIFLRGVSAVHLCDALIANRDFFIVARRRMALTHFALDRSIALSNTRFASLAPEIEVPHGSSRFYFQAVD